ncbi:MULTISPECIES: phosphonate ABC transporter, permease protein PhnE [unclassified Frigoribacterium]|uniref:phosphonate ABC transporter, permease protein PhnE n=1 Tax=unclassified Frigoribacterium TaxID=2627005 RepID=UPI001562FC05|nr:MULTISPECIES: phosphonate ABC transporter, permease protein PhnE [unclassified Frigoribacterium]NQW87721.1 phosphonate ABC transporter, permease protein PhnE [Frigoribacterium sp. VKM Ac-2860]NQX09470.1 phosphonate ABC transporter, permease protein PhnE [Frigoribacterium sp. VKM Ac-2859]
MTAVTERPRTTGAAPAPVTAPPRRRVPPERVAAGLTLVALLVASLVALRSVDIDPARMLQSWANAERFFGRVGAIEFPPLGELLQLTALTLGLVICGTLLAAVLSVPVAVLAASNTTPGPAWRAAARFVTVLARAVPDVVLAMVFVLLFSLGTLPGILAIGLHSVGMISKLFADAIEQIDEGPRTAVRAAGGSRLQQFTAGVLPQVLPSWVATVLHRNDINLRGSVILGYVGVVGLGMEMSFAFKSLDYGLGLGYALVIFVLCVVMEIVSSSVRATMLGIAPTGRGLGDRVVRRATRRRGAGHPVPSRPVPATVESALRRPWDRGRRRTVAWGWLAVAVVVASIAVCDIAWSDLVTVWAKVPAVATQFWPPSFGSYEASTMVAAMGETIAIALAATVLTLVASIVVGSLAARNVAPSRGVRSGMRLLLVGIRGVPEVILAIVLIVVTGLGTQAGTLALALGGVGLLGKLLADSFEEVSPGPERALSATGASRVQVYAGATLPQGTRALIGHTFYMLDTNLRAATLLGIVGAGGVGYYLLNASQGSNYGTVTAIVLMILVTVLVVEGLAIWMRRVFR